MSAFVKRAERRGYITPGWNILDYIREAIKTHGWECIIIHGIKGTLKSNFMMQLLYHTYQDWEWVHKYIMMEPIDFIDAAEEGGRIGMLGYDDISAHLPSHLYHINRRLYHALTKDWALIRPELNVFCCTTPHKHRIAPFILEDMTSEILTNKSFTYDHQRWAWDINLKDFRSEIAKPVMAETEMKIEMDNVPYEEFKRYWQRRLELTKKARGELLDYMKELQNEFQTTNKLNGEITKDFRERSPKELKTIAGRINRLIRDDMTEEEKGNTLDRIFSKPC